MYPLNWPLSKLVASLGIPLSIKVNVMFDPEANVYVATSPNLRGLVLEADSLDKIRSEVEIAVPELISLNHFNLPAKHNRHTFIQFHADLNAA